MLPAQREIAAYLHSLEPLYPFGVPLELIQADPAESVRVLFVGYEEGESSESLPFPGEAGTLFRAAVVDGMKIPLREVHAVNLATDKHTKSELLAATKAAIVVILGPRTLEALLGPEFRAGRGEWFALEDRVCILSHELSAVISDKQRKKEFWLDLQSVLRKL